MVAPVPPQTAMSAVLEDGRRISWAEYGSASGAPLVLLHGTPGSRLQFRLPRVEHDPTLDAGPTRIAGQAHRLTCRRGGVAGQAAVVSAATGSSAAGTAGFGKAGRRNSGALNGFQVPSGWASRSATAQIAAG
jgi:hypothetical protein